MSLQQQINLMQQEMLQQIPGDILDTLMTAKAQLVADKPEHNALKEGDPIPCFSLYTVAGNPLDIGDVLKEKNLVISFYRGSWCPYCNIELRSLVEFYPAIKAAGAELIAISPELPDQSMTYIEKQQIPFRVLSDPGNLVAKQFGIVVHLSQALRKVYKGFDFDLVKKNGDLYWKLPIPATYLVTRDGIIHHASINPDYTQRMEPEEIVRELQLMK